jgi:hypothetical protein
MSSLSSIWDVSQEQENYLKQVKKCETFIFVKKGRCVLSSWYRFFHWHRRLFGLKNENDIKRIDVDYMIDSVIVEFDPSIITKEEIKGSELVSNDGCRSQYTMN